MGYKSFEDLRSLQSSKGIQRKKIYQLIIDEKYRRSKTTDILAISKEEKLKVPINMVSWINQST